MFRKIKELFTLKFVNMPQINTEFLKDEEGNEISKQHLTGSTIQWDQGKNKGIVQIIAKFQTEQGVEYIYFTDGNRALASGLNTAFQLISPGEELEDASGQIIQFVPSSEYWSIERIRAYADGEEWIPPTKAIVPILHSAPSPVFAAPDAIAQNIQILEPATKAIVEKSPLLSLLDKQVKAPRIVKFAIEIEVPSSSTMKILKESFEDFDDNFALWIQQDEKILEAVMTELKNRLIKA